MMEELTLEGWERVETHISVVLLGPREVLKRKKPVQLGFLDFSTLALRKAACEAELSLNRRLAADVYLGVEAITRDADGALALGGEGEVVDYAVRMRRLPDSDRADLRLDEGRLDEALLGRIAAHIARFHRDAAHGPEVARFGAAELVAQNVDENFKQAGEALREHLGREEAEELERYQRDFVSRRAPFLERVAHGRIRDGHGDLRLEHIYIDDAGTIRIIDCIEFNERFRYQDVAADVAFLAMDLARSGAPRLAEVFVGAYAEAAQDYDLYPMLDFYESYRAFVRGKVATMLAADSAASPAAREQAVASARQAFLLAVASERGPLVPPQLIAVGGIIGSGKSSVSAALGAKLGAPRVDSDSARKFLTGVDADTSLAAAGFADAYSHEATARVYRELNRRAELVLRSGRPVLLDASFRTAELRADARAVAEAAGVPFVFIECEAPRPLIEARLRARESEPGLVSDARVELLEDFIARYEAPTELPEGSRFVADTARPLDETIDALLEVAFGY